MIAVADFKGTILINLSIRSIGSLCGNKLSIFFLSISLFTHCYILKKSLIGTAGYPITI